MEPGEEPETGPHDMTHSERVFALSTDDRIVDASIPEATPPEVADSGSESPWIYDVMDADEPDVEQPTAGSAE
jgi:hypothetical protein